MLEAAPGYGGESCSHIPAQPRPRQDISAFSSRFYMRFTQEQQPVGGLERPLETAMAVIATIARVLTCPRCHKRPRWSGNESARARCPGRRTRPIALPGDRRWTRTVTLRMLSASLSKC